MGKKNELIKKIVLKSTTNGPAVLFDQSKKYLLTNAMAVYKCNEFLRRLGTGLEIKFESFNQYNRLLSVVASELNIPYFVE